ncbi:MAG: putative tRNA-dihydrouridine synthase 2 [Patescibacteria group bacterium]|nr:MAG: putative tRNA-dihydrouridine synthase 2 [Patescibacteria group bacterium]
MDNFWQKLPKPIFALAPMENVTDTVFRRIIISCGRPSVVFTEFTNVDGLFSRGSEIVNKRLIFTKEESPIVAQIWGVNPENYFKAAKLIKEKGFQGIDINMGCPDRSVIKKGVCSALINNRSLAKEIIEATKEGAENLPVSVKTRIGFQNIITEDWIGFLLEQDLACITIHARTVKELSKVPAHWDEIKKAVKLKDNINPKTIIIGNGDIGSYEEAIKKINLYEVDGVMIGRGVFHDPWIFNPSHHGADVTFDEKIKKFKEHIELFEKTWGEEKPFHEMKKLFKCYINGIKNATIIRNRLIKLSTSNDLKSELQKLQAEFLLGKNIT